MFKVIREFILKLSAPYWDSSGAISERVPSLNHKFGNNTMENHPLEVATSRMTNKILHGFGRLLREETHMDVAQSRVYRRGVGKWRGPRLLSNRSSGNILLFSGGALIEHVTLTRFVVPKT